MKWRARSSHVVIALAVIAAVAIAAPAIGGPSLKKLVKKEVAKQIGKATGPAGPAGTNGINGVDGTARAYARVNTNCDANGICPFAQSKGITSVTRVSAGTYCVTAPGISSASTPAAVTVFWSGTGTPGGNTSAMLASGACSGGGFEVVTERQPITAVRNAADNGSVNVAGNAVLADNVAFTIVIP